MARWRVADSAERLVYRVAGLPVALSAALGEPDPLHSAFARRYWHPDGIAEWSELIAGLALWPFGLLAAMAWFTWRNGPAIRARYGKKVREQLSEQLSLYFSDGVLAPWYYIFSLHDEGAQRAPTFIQRFETKSCYFRILKRWKGTPLNDKSRFAQFCAEHDLRSVPTLLHLEGERPPARLPDEDLFVKPADGRGGRGAERWDRVAPSTFSGPGADSISGDRLLERLVERSREHALIVQPRLRPHQELLEITAGALPTIRVLTCLNADSEPEVMAAMMRTSFGKNRTVDNLHAGGIGALVDLDSGKLSKSSNLGSDARLGWFSTHPDTGASIEGRVVPLWDEVKEAAVAAHRQFSDRVVVGWDIAVLDDGPILVEGNGNPDLDILQRYMRIGLRQQRLAELLAHHLRLRGANG
jgi:hypothetical protein